MFIKIHDVIIKKDEIVAIRKEDPKVTKKETIYKITIYLRTFSNWSMNEFYFYCKDIDEQIRLFYWIQEELKC